MIHVIGPNYEGEVEVWLDTEAELQDGLCIGCQPSRREALTDAIVTFEGEIEVLRALRDQEDGLL